MQRQVENYRAETNMYLLMSFQADDGVLPEALHSSQPEAGRADRCRYCLSVNELRFERTWTNKNRDLRAVVLTKQF